MATLYEVTLVQREEGAGGEPVISFLAGPLPNAGYYKITRAEAIQGIQQGYWIFYVRLGRNTTYVEVIRNAQGELVLGTRADTGSIKQLLALSDFMEVENSPGLRSREEMMRAADYLIEEENEQSMAAESNEFLNYKVA